MIAGLPKLPLYYFPGFMLFEQTRAMTSTLDFHRINISMLRRPREQKKWQKKEDMWVCTLCVPGLAMLYFLCSSFICYIRLLQFLHTWVLVNAFLPSADIQSCLIPRITRMMLINPARAGNKREKTAVSFEISIRAPMRERAPLAASLLWCAW